MRRNSLDKVNSPKRWWGLPHVNGLGKGVPYFPALIGVYPTLDTTEYTMDTERLFWDNEET